MHSGQGILFQAPQGIAHASTEHLSEKMAE